MSIAGKEAQGLISTRAFAGKKVVGGSSGVRHLGKVRACVFHPEEKRCIGFLVKRPDAALMFRRADLFVALSGYSVDPVTEALVVSKESESSGKNALKALGVDLQDCFVWERAPIECEDGTSLGVVGEVRFDSATGKVQQVVVDAGAVEGLLKGRREIEASLIRGLRLFTSDEQAQLGESVLQAGVLLVADSVKDLELQGSVAQQAGKAAGAAADKAREVAAEQAPKVKAVAAQVGQSAKETGAQVSKLAAKGVVAAGKATGRQIGKTRNAIDAFKEEFNKALNDEDGA